VFGLHLTPRVSILVRQQNRETLDSSEAHSRAEEYNLSEKSMKRRVAELITIFLGVGLAFLAEDWREYRGDRAEEREALSSLAADFTENEKFLSERLDDHRRILRQLQRLDEYLDSKEDGAVVPVPDTLLVALFVTPTYDPVRGTVDALLTSGRLGVIRDADLRQALSGWSAQVLDADEEEKTDQRALLTDVLFPFFLQSEIPLRDLMATSSDWFFRSVPEAVSGQTTTLRVSAGLKSVVALRLSNAGRIVLELDMLTEYQDGLLSQLRGANR